MNIIIVSSIAMFVLQNIIIQAYGVTEEFLNEDEQACVVSTDVSEDVVVEAKKTSTVPVNEPNYKEFLSCCWNRYGYQKESGEINWEIIEEVLGKSYKPAVAHKLVEKCDKIEGETHGDTVALVLYCLDEHAPNHISLQGYYGGHHD